MQEEFKINVFFKSDGESVEKIITHYLINLLNSKIDNFKYSI